MQEVPVEICPYYNNHQTAASLMMDDLAPAAVIPHGSLAPFLDHGYGMDEKGGHYHYFKSQFLARYPEVKGTFFILTEYHSRHVPGHQGYQVKRREWDTPYFDFLRRLKPQFSLAFHGTNHGEEKHGVMQHEFSYRRLDEVDDIRKSIQNFENAAQINFFGGKFPGYQANDQALAIVEKLGFHWWAHGHDMKSMRRKSSKPYYRKTWPPLAKVLYRRYHFAKAEAHLHWLYEKGWPITVQEHFSTMRTNGTFQRPNVFDDLNALEHIYSLLRGADIWHCTCDELAHYIVAKDHSTLRQKDHQLEIQYRGSYAQVELSLRSKERFLLKSDHQQISPLKRGSYWVYNNLRPGVYTMEAFAK